MSLEQKIEALTAAIEANTAALLAAPTSPKAEKAATPPKTEKAATPPKTEKAAYVAKHTKPEAQAAITEVKEKLGVATAKGIIKQVGFDKLGDMVKPEDFDTLYELAKKALGAEEPAEEEM